jgi:hypothetical protein
LNWLIVWGLKPLKIQNEYGETIGITFDGDGVIQICHSDIDPNAWGVLHESDKRTRQASVKDSLAEKGFDISNPIVAAMMKEFAGRAGGYIVLTGKSDPVNAEETALIHAAVKHAGGIVPNWSSQP